jgi:hypothetical protein
VSGRSTTHAEPTRSLYPRFGAILIDMIRRVLLVACVFFCPHPIFAQTLSPFEIASAIRWGQQGNPQPFLLHHRPAGPSPLSGSVKENPVVVGVIYTPYIRVALFSAFRWYGSIREGVPLDDPHIGWFLNGTDSLFGPNRAKRVVLSATAILGIPPTWVKPCDEVLPTFGGTPLYDDFAGIAAFPIPSPETPHEYLISRHYLVDGKEGTLFATGRLKPPGLK